MKAVGAPAIADVDVPLAELGPHSCRQRLVRDVGRDVRIEAVWIDRIDVAIGARIPAPGKGVGVPEIVAAEAIERDILPDRYPRIQKGAEVVERGVPELTSVDVPLRGVGWTVGAFLGQILRRHVHEPEFTHANPVVRAQLHVLAVPALIAQHSEFRGRLGVVESAGDAATEFVHRLLEHDVDHPRDSVGAVLGAGAVAQDLDAVDRRQRDGVEVGPGVSTATRPEDVDEG